MGTKTIKFDDLDGETTEDVQSVPFLAPYGEDGSWVRMTIDLGPETRKAFEEFIMRYAEHGQVVTEPAQEQRRATSSGQSQAYKEWLDRVRTWARDNDYEVSEKGRLAQNIVTKYLEQNPDDTKPE